MPNSADGPGTEKLSFLWEDQAPSETQIERINTENLKRHANFRTAADYVSRGLATIRAVRKIALFGSVAVPPYREKLPVGRFTDRDIEVYHPCADIDIAVWIDETGSIDELRTARLRALALLLQEKGIGVAHHQVDIFLLDDGTGDYLGRLCIFGRCPAGKYVCGVEGCGKTPFIRIHDGFIFKSMVFDKSEALCLYEHSENN